MNAAVYVWRNPLGRVAVVMVVVGLIGLVLHYWCGFLMLAALPNYSGSPRDGVDPDAAEVVAPAALPGGWAAGASNPRGVPVAP